MLKNLTRLEIEQYLPHSDTMCLLDEVSRTTEQSLWAQTKSHLSTDNPLMINGRIAAVNGIEYAAQAMALHGYLLSGEQKDGYIASVRNIKILAPFLPLDDVPIVIQVDSLLNDPYGFTYQFLLSSQKKPLISGKITVFLI